VLADVDVSIIVPQRQPTPLLLGKGKASYTGEMWVTLPKADRRSAGCGRPGNS
jgi:hypothetical protein